jgi:hypothetical protein
MKKSQLVFGAAWLTVLTLSQASGATNVWIRSGRRARAFVAFICIVLGQAGQVSAQLPVGLPQIPQAGMTATASSTNTIYYPSKAIDGNNATFWQTDIAPEQWIQFDLGSRHTIGAIEVYSGASYRIKGYRIYVTDQASPAAWDAPVAVGELLNATGSTAIPLTYTTGRYVRFVVASRWSSASCLYEFRIYGNPALLADLQTGSTAFSNSNTVDVVSFPAFAGYTHFQAVAGAAAPDPSPSAWTATNTPPATLSFAQPATDANVRMTLWFTNLVSAVAPKRNAAQILYATDFPDPRIDPTLTRYLYAGYPAVTLTEDDFDADTTFGSYFNRPIDRHEIILACPADATPASPEVTLTTPGVYEVTFTAVNAVGNSASLTGTVTVVEAGLSTLRRWTGAGANALASTANNWGGGIAPVSGDHVLFDAAHAGNAQTNCSWDLNVAPASWEQTTNYAGTVTIQTRYPGQGSFTNLVISGSVLLARGVWTHTANPAGNTEVNRLAVKVGNDFSLKQNAFVNVDGKGYAAGAYGPGKGSTENYAGYGASHGGWDAERQSAGPYGSIVHPTTLGSSCAGRAGGGAVLLEVSGTCMIDGTLSAVGLKVDASAGSEYNAGAGGSILVKAGTLSGNGLLNARGGRAFYGGSAGGGRIAMIAANGTDFGGIQALAGGGINGPGNYVYYEGSAGTIYQEHAGHQPGKGVLTIAAYHSAYRYSMVHWPVTEMPKASAWNPAVNLDDFSRIVITNGGTLGIVSDTVMTNWSLARLQVAGSENSFITVRSTNGVAFPPQMTVSSPDFRLSLL